MGVVNSKMGVTAIFSRAFRAHSVLCLPTRIFLRAPLKSAWFTSLLVEPKLSSSSEDEGEHIITSKSEKLHQVWEFCKGQSKSVEVLYENMNGCKILTRIHFHFDPSVIARY